MEFKLLRELELIFDELTPADFLALKKKSSMGKANEDESAKYLGIAGKIEALKIINMLDVMNCEA